MKIWNRLTLGSAIPNEIKIESEKSLQTSKQLTNSLLNYQISNDFKYCYLSQFYIKKSHIIRPKTKANLKEQLVQLLAPNPFYFSKVDTSEKDTMPSITHSTSNIFKVTTLRKSRNNVKLYPSLTKTTSQSIKHSAQLREGSKERKSISYKIRPREKKKSNLQLINFKRNEHTRNLHKSLSQIFQSTKNCRYSLSKLQLQEALNDHYCK